MYIFETTLDDYLKIKERLSEIYPSVSAEIISSDENLKRLGFADYIPCTWRLEIDAKRMERLMDDLMQYEIDAYNCAGNPDESSPTFRAYLRYGWMWDVLRYPKEIIDDIS